jgi:hypothetical protein
MTDSGEPLLRIDEFRALREQVERSILPLAASVGGRRFRFRRQLATVGNRTVGLLGLGVS